MFVEVVMTLVVEGVAGECTSGGGDVILVVD
jgi:hypothetical protein